MTEARTIPDTGAPGSETAAAPQPFDVAAPLPGGTTVLEASAGTGKTYAIVGVAARKIADGLPIDKLLLVTFSRSASAELRERMRARLADLVVALDPARVHADRDGDDDPVLRAVLTGSPDDIAARRGRLIQALSDFDASTIATTHTFCNRMLEALGFLGERELIYDVVEDTDDIVEQTALDLYLSSYAGDADRPPFSVGEAMAIAREAVRSAGVPLAPQPDDTADATPSAATQRVRFCERVRSRVERRKRLARLRTYDDLQTILYRVVTDPEFGEAACKRIRASFELILVDEFQDTDPFQWEILRRCFHGHRQLVLVGDPKQSIYAFRGAEVRSYLTAVDVADSLRALDTNHRSDADLVTALDRIYGGASLGDRSITVHPVRAARSGSRISGAPALRMRALSRSDFTIRGKSGFPSVADVRSAITADVANDIARLLTSDTRLDTGDGPRAVTPGDIAILVRTNGTIEPLQRALSELGIASVVGTGTSVFRTIGALHWLWVIRAIEQPARADRVRLAALTPLIGWDASELAEATDTRLAELSSMFAELGRVFADGGFAALSQRLLAAENVAGRVLGIEDGERALTDLLQVASLVNKHVVENECGLAGVVEWLADRIADESQWRRHEDQTRRLDRDTHVVQIMTVHASKGLEFPIVYVPFGWDAARVSKPKTFRYHDDAGCRHLDVGGEGTRGWGERIARRNEEEAGEDLRLLYVALTRASSQVVMHWAPSFNTSKGPLHRLLFGRRQHAGETRRGTDAETVPTSVNVPDDHTCVSTLRALAADPPVSISVEHADDSPAPVWTPPDDDDSRPELDVARFTRTIDQQWRRTSYSALIAGAAHQHPTLTTGSEPEVGSAAEGELITDEPVDPADRVDSGDPYAATDPAAAQASTLPDGTPSLMNGMPFGAAFGTLVHEVLEYVDTAAPDIDDHVRELCATSATRHALDVDVDDLAAALRAVLTTPLASLGGTLWSVGPRDRLAELDFEFPLGNAASTPSAAAVLSDVAALMNHHLPEEDPLRAYAESLAEIPPRALRGYLTGSIDSVLRTSDGRYVVVDYKTNRLRPGELSAEDFTADAMAAEMIGAHYPLQALLYSVALHRYLRWRLPGYTPAEHLGPVQYHFVRGMVGADTPPGCGVYEWDIPTGLVTELSDLLGGIEGGDDR
ncbi:MULTISPECIES: UvrD-helicase domain-containing protein [Gordonia]|uniref:UvrD-helicase domain-containing protein n=1 Tax=Gordonia TaxID=2053 RepID=UPI00257FC32E|nr:MULTISPECIES: UvrD-helicase domain-containing protein [Gordonia]